MIDFPMIGHHFAFLVPNNGINKIKVITNHWWKACVLLFHIEFSLYLDSFLKLWKQCTFSLYWGHSSAQTLYFLQNETTGWKDHHWLCPKAVIESYHLVLKMLEFEIRSRLELQLYPWGKRNHSYDPASLLAKIHILHRKFMGSKRDNVLLCLEWYLTSLILSNKRDTFSFLIVSPISTSWCCQPWTLVNCRED